MAIPKFIKGWLGGRNSLPISSPMGMRWGKMHKGIDIAIPVGTTIKAPAAGRIVTRKVQKNGAGLYVVLRVESGNEYYNVYFMHLKEASVTVGQEVLAGEQIALSGGDPSDQPNCGNTTGPHLHFEIRKQGTVAVNPIPFLQEKCVLKSTGEILKQETKETPVPPPTPLQSVSEYANKDVTSVTDPNAAERKKKVKKKIVSGAQERLAPGIWQIVKLLMDSSAANRQIFDSSISMQTGPLINFFNKMCQQPLVEFSGDTYGDQYYFMIRKPPYDKEGILKMQELTMINIEDSDIRSTNLSWNIEGIYSWYQMIPFEELAGMNQLNLYMPAIFFPEYAAVWGSKDLTIHNQYVNYYQSGRANTGVDDNKKANGENIIRNAVRDLKYIIESNAYNPFTRKGTITLNGDRRIKRGTLIMMPNGEQFYVDAVSNSYSVGETSVNRSTTLTVSRGMFSKYVNEVKIDGKMISYFNLIDFGKDFDVSKVTSENWKDIVSTWKVNVDVFAFFLKRSQLVM